MLRLRGPMQQSPSDLGRLDLTLPQLRALWVVRSSGSITIGGIAAAAMGRQPGECVGARRPPGRLDFELVTRREDPSDRRQTLVALRSRAGPPGPGREAASRTPSAIAGAHEPGRQDRRCASLSTYLRARLRGGRLMNVIEVQDLARLRRDRGRQGRHVRRRGGRDLRLPRPQRRRQDDHHQHALHPAPPDRGNCAVNGFDVRTNGARCAARSAWSSSSPPSTSTSQRRAEPRSTATPTPSRPRSPGATDDRAAGDGRPVGPAKGRVRTYSGGMKRRLEIARGLLHHPKSCSSTSPPLGLDPQTRATSGTTCTSSASRRG